MRCWLFALTCLLASASRAHADDPPIRKPASAVALDHLARATKLYNVRSFAEAADEYKAGALEEPAPVFDYNLGQCYRQLGRYQDAIWHYERFVRSSPETPIRNEIVATFLAQMRAELESRARTAPPTDPASGAPPPIAAAPPNAAATRVATAHWYDDRAGWALVAGGVIALAGSGTLFASAAQLTDDANHTAAQRAAAELHDRAEIRAQVGVALGVAGIGLALAGGIKLWSTPGDSRASIALSPAGVSVIGRF